MSETKAVVPTRGSTKRLAQCTTLQQAFETAEFRDRIAAGVPHHMNPDRLLRTFIQAASRTPALYRCDLRTVLGAMLTCSQAGLEPNTPLGHAYLIPFDRRGKLDKPGPDGKRYGVVGTDCQLIFGYRGLLELSYRSPRILNIHCDVVWPGDIFEHEYGSNAHLQHIPKGKRKEGDLPEYAYMHANLTGGGQAFEVLPYSEVQRIRNASQAYRTALAAKEKAEKENWKSLPGTWTEAPWVKHEAAMARKTAFRSGSKWLPTSVEMASAFALDEAADRGARPDFGKVLDGDFFADGLPIVEGDEMDESDAAPAALAHEQTMDAGAAFGMRQQPEPERVPVEQPRQQAPQQQPAPPAQRQPEPERAPPPAEMEPQRSAEHEALDEYYDRQMMEEGRPDEAEDEFNFELVDHLGDANPEGPFSSHAQWVREAIASLHGLDPASAAQMAENNEAAFDAVKRIGGTFWDDLTHALEETTGRKSAPADQQVAAAPNAAPEAAPEAAPPFFIEMPMNRGKPMNSEFVKLWQQVMQRCHSRDDLQEAKRVNDHWIWKQPKAQKLEIDKAYAMRAQELGLSTPQKYQADQAAPQPDSPPQQQAAQQDQQAPAEEDRDAKRADNILEEIERCADMHALTAYAEGVSVKTTLSRWEREGRTDCLERVQAAAVARRAKLAGKSA